MGSYDGLYIFNRLISEGKWTSHGMVYTGGGLAGLIDK